MTELDFDAMLPAVRAAARDAAEILLAGFRSRPAVERKGSAVDLVTKFDRESEALLKGRLHAEFGVPVIGEEGVGGNATDASELVFYVDPLDGTTNFVHGHPFWCVSIGLVAAGQPVLGVVLAPPLGLEWFGWIRATGESESAGARQAGLAMRHAGQDTVCAVSATAALDEAMLATGFPYDRRTSPENNFSEFTRLKRRVQAIRRCGSAAIDLCFVADGTYDGYWEQKLSPWDVAAGIALVRAAGGRVTGYDGRSVSLDAPSAIGLVATNGAIHDALLQEIAAARSDARRGV
jgi:myo-inositol-1(or 4)-monophosphatase